jgi:hypothetical protein
VYFEVELIRSADLDDGSKCSLTHALLDIATSLLPLLLRLARGVGCTVVVSDCGVGSDTFCRFDRRAEGGLFSSELSTGMGARGAEAFLFREVVTGGLGVEREVDG